MDEFDSKKDEEIALLTPPTDKLPPTDEIFEKKVPELNLKEQVYDEPSLYSESIVSVMLPVSITMIIVIWAIQTLSPILSSTVLFQSIDIGQQFQVSEGQSIWIQIGFAILTAVIMVIAIIVVTIFLVILYKFRCLKLIFGWFIFSTFILLLFMGGIWLDFILKAYSLKLDYFSFFFFLYNFSIVGLISVFWISPAIFTQVYLIIISSMTSWWLSRLPEWTTWAILIAVALYDIFAVLTPKGPLRILVETAQERNEPLPGLIYEGNSVKLGLGDFVFYSLLVGRASMYDFTTCIVCFISILIGLGFTLFILAFTRKALPALPISIFLGTISYVTSRFIILPFVLTSSMNRILV